jgi:DNA-binding CsgD family transcriptional regulator
VSIETVKFHLASIFGKLGASNRTDATRQALRRGLIAL